MFINNSIFCVLHEFHRIVIHVFIFQTVFFDSSFVGISLYLNNNTHVWTFRHYMSKTKNMLYLLTNACIFSFKKSKYGEYTQIEQEWTLINGHINNWTRTLDNDLMGDTRPIVKDTFAHTNTSMILGSCELLGFFFIFSVIVLTQKGYIFRHFGIYYLYLGYARIWNTIKIEIIVKWQTRMSLEPHPYPTPEIFFSIRSAHDATYLVL